MLPPRLPPACHPRGHRRGPPRPPARRPRQHRPRHAPLHRRAHRPHSPRWRHRRAHLPGRPGFWSAKTIKCLRRHGVRYSITVRQTKPVRHAIAQIPEPAWTDICYPDTGVAQVAETRLKGDRLIVRRVRHLQAQAELFPTWQYDAFVTDRPGTAIWLDTDHRRHATVELAIRDLKNGAASTTAPPGGSPPTPPGCWQPRWRTTLCAGPPSSGSAPATSCSAPRPCGGPCLGCRAG